MTSPFSYIRLFLFFLFVGEFNLYAGGYLSSAASHDSTWMVLQGSYRQDIIRVSVTATSGAGSCGVSDLSFVMQNTNNADVLNAKLWYNTTNNYSTATQKSSTINSPSGTITFSSIGVTGISNTTVYFWLSFDISASATQCSNSVDAYVPTDGLVITGTGAGNKTPSTPNPSGNRIIGGPGCWSYCPSTYTNTTDDYIKQVKFNTINNNTLQDGANSYGNYIAQSTNVTRGATYNIELAIYIAGAFTQHIKVFFDWNNNGSFAEADEIYDLGSITGTAGGGTWGKSANILVPATATLGTTRMRVIEQFNTSPTACDAHPTAYGETEDYTVVVTDDMVYSASVVTQTNTGGVSAGATSQEIIAIKVTTVGTNNPISATSLSLNTLGTSGTDNPLTNIQNAKLIYTGSSSIFATTPQVGTTISSPNGLFDFTFSQALLTGDNYFWLTYDIRAGAITGELVDAMVNNIVLSSGTYIPTSKNPVGSRPIGPMTYVSSTVRQITPVVGINTTNNHILRIEVVTKGALSPISATSFSINANGTTVTVTSKVQNGKIFYTGTDSTFNTSTQFGSTVAAIDASTVAITGTQELSMGTNYFWLAMDVKSTALVGDLIDGECSSITIGTPQVPSVIAPSGSRKVGVAWTGTTSTNWRVATNWSSGVIPTSTTDVIISPAPTNQPVIDGPLYSTNQNGDCRDIYIMPGATLIIKATSTSPSPMAGNEKGKLMVNGNFTNDGTVNIIHFTLGMPVPGDYILPIYLNGNGTIGGTGSMPAETGYPGFYNGYFLVNDGATYSLASNFPKNGEVLLDLRVGGSGSGAIFSMGGYSLRTNGITVMANNTFNQNTGKLMLEGQKTIAPTTNLNSPYGVYTGGTINLGNELYFTKDVVTDNFQRHIIKINVPYKNVIVETEALTEGSTGIITFDNLELRNSGSAENTMLLWGSSDIVVNQNITIGNNCRIKPSVSSNQVLNVKGNWINNGTFQGKSDDNVRKISTKFIGTSEQNVLGDNSTTFSFLTTNNSSSTGVVLGKPTIVSDSITFIDGNIYSSSTNLLTLNDNAVTNTGTAISFVDGPIKKIGNDAFVFPVGDDINTAVSGDEHWAPIEISAPANTNTEFTAQYFRTYAPQPTYDTTLAALTTPLQKVSNIEYWNLDRGVTSDAVSVKLHWKDAAKNGINDCTSGDLVVAHWNTGTSKWEDMSNASPSYTGLCGAGQAGTVSTTGTVSSFSPFTFGSKTRSSGTNPLPITLLYFNAEKQPNHSVLLTWATSTEINNDYFTIERSKYGEYFEEIAKVDGAGNSNTIKEYKTYDYYPYKGVSYYRLKQTDFDGKYSYSNTVAVKVSEDGFANVYPNPFKDEVIISLSGSIENGFVKIYNPTGQLLFNELLSEHNNNLITINTSQLPAGVYFIAISDGNELLSTRLIKE